MPEEREFCTFYLDGLYFGVRVQDVQEVLRHQEMISVPLAPSIVSGLINLRGKIVTALNLRRRLKMSDLAEGQLPMNVVVRTNEGVVSLLVDEIGDVLNVEEDSFERPPDTINESTRELIQGVYKLKDKLLLILDTQKTVSLSSS